jgi:hypothetical protein
VSGVVSGVLLQSVHMTTMEGVRTPAMALVGGAVHTGRTPLAWVGYLVYAVLIGAAFGWLLASQRVYAGAGLVWGVLYGAAWWIVSSLLIIPSLYGVPPLTPAAVDVVRNASLPWFGAMLLDGGVLGAAYVGFMNGRPPRTREEAVTTPRAA